jgi:phage/conjugal plasmid C-4 type zinc finger TraR family protein
MARHTPCCRTISSRWSYTRSAAISCTSWWSAVGGAAVSDRGDVIDRAQAHEEELRSDALAAHARKTAVARKSALRCTNPSCDVRIPAARRNAVPGVQLCIECQELKEKTRGGYVAN